MTKYLTQFQLTYFRNLKEQLQDGQFCQINKKLCIPKWVAKRSHLTLKLRIISKSFWNAIFWMQLFKFKIFISPHFFPDSDYSVNPQFKGAVIQSEMVVSQYVWFCFVVRKLLAKNCLPTIHPHVTFICRFSIFLRAKRTQLDLTPFPTPLLTQRGCRLHSN